MKTSNISGPVPGALAQPVHTCNHSTWEADEGGTWVQGQLLLCREPHVVRLGHVRAPQNPEDLGSVPSTYTVVIWMRCPPYTLGVYITGSQWPTVWRGLGVHGLGGIHLSLGEDAEISRKLLPFQFSSLCLLLAARDLPLWTRTFWNHKPKINSSTSRLSHGAYHTIQKSN